MMSHDVRGLPWSGIRTDSSLRPSKITHKVPTDPTDSLLTSVGWRVHYGAHHSHDLNLRVIRVV